MSGNFAETYFPVIELQQTRSWSKENAIYSAVAANVFMMSTFCPFSEGIYLSEKFNLLIWYQYQVNHNVTS